MAEVVIGLGSSHSPQLSMLPEAWESRAGANDQRNPELIGTDGIVSGYEDLLARTDVKRIAREIDPKVQQQRHEANQRGIAKVAEALKKAKPDILVMFGDDQQEYLTDDNMPGFCIYWGDEVKVLGQGEKYTAATGFQPLIGYPPEDKIVPTQSALGRHLIEYLAESEYDIGSSKYLDPTRGGRSRGGIGHAFGYVYHRIMDGMNIPTVPIMVNTYYPPNQPTPKRCYDIGRTIRSAIEAWPTKARVAVLASGGLSHFVVDEELDQMTIKGLKEKDIVQLSQLPRERMNSGNSEARNWISLGGAAEHLDMELFDYVPCYRSPAGTGCAMAFAQWT
jgi:3-O-methylgallate 3,4-dioxygenase